MTKTDTNTLAPTDAEIIALADETRTGEPGRDGYILPISFARAVLAKWGAPAPSASVEQEAMQMLWDDQQQEEKEHYRNVARGTELPLYAIHHPEDIDKTKRRAAPEQPVAPAPAASEALITIESSLRFRLACAKDDAEQLEFENRRLRERVAGLKADPASQPVAVPAGMEPVARIEGIDEYGPRLEWRQHWVDVGVGANLFTAAQVQAMLAATPTTNQQHKESQ